MQDSRYWARSVIKVGTRLRVKASCKTVDIGPGVTYLKPELEISDTNVLKERLSTWVKARYRNGYRNRVRSHEQEMSLCPPCTPPEWFRIHHGRPLMIWCPPCHNGRSYQEENHRCDSSHVRNGTILHLRVNGRIGVTDVPPVSRRKPLWCTRTHEGGQYGAQETMQAANMVDANTDEGAL